VRQVLENALENEAKPHFVDAFKAIVADWDHAPDFAARKSITNDSITVSVYATGKNKQIYEYVTKGTRPHTISAKNAPSLVFMWGGPGSYKPKTAPGGVFGGPGVVVGGKLTFRKQVHHPGTKARKFEEFIRKREKVWFSRTMENAWRRAIRAMKG
jgi:hypothetical protein